jgi:hypothetical protein
MLEVNEPKSGPIVKQWWTGRDLNPRPQRCQRCDHSKLIYPPVFYEVIRIALKKLLSLM